MPRPLTQAPFYAIEVEPVLHHTMGGIKINSKAEVVNKSGTPVPGLYAAGEVTGGVHGAIAWEEMLLRISLYSAR